MLHVTVIEGAEVVRSQVLRANPALIGRDAASDIVVRNKHISGTHAEIRLDEGRVVFRDLGSTNGSWLRRNRWLVAVDARRDFTIELQDGDEVLLGNQESPVRLRFCLVDASLAKGLPPSELLARREGEHDASRRECRPGPVDPVVQDFTSRVTENAGPRLILESLASSCLARFRAASDVVIYLCEGVLNALSPALHRGCDGDEPPRPLPEHVAVNAFRSGSTIVFGSAEAGLQSLCAPVINGAQPVGLIQVVRSRKAAGEFGEEDAQALSELARQAAPPLTNARLRHSVERSLGLLISAAESRDRFRSGRSAAVAELVQRLGEQLGVKRPELRQMVSAAMVHDLGMLAVPSTVLSKTSPLTKEERELVRTHVRTSVSILEPIPLLADLIPIVQHHHERWDGTGYPNGLAGDGIPIGSRILAVADAFCALVSHAPHRRAVDEAAALEELKRCSGSQFEPAVVEAAFSVIDGSERWTEGAATEAVRLDGVGPGLVVLKS